MAASMRPLASAGFDGTTTLRPGMWVKSPSRLDECWPADERRMPSEARSTSGTDTWPPDIDRNLAAWLTISSIAPRVNSTKLIDATGRSPVRAAPTEAAMMIASEIGMSMMRSGPNSSTRPRNWPKLPPQLMSSPRTITRSSSRMARAVASTVACPKVILRSVMRSAE